MNDQDSFLDDALEKRKEVHRFRTLKSYKPADTVTLQKNGQEYLDFCSNDYLGLANHPEVKKRAKTYLEKYGTGSRASRLINGTFDIHTRLENAIADTFGSESALIFNSGFQANSSILGTVSDRNSLILADRLSHNSLLQGSLASRAAFKRFNHNDINHLEKLLQKAKDKNYNRIWIVTETVFSMDGDRSPLKKIAELAQQYSALLFVDDAHAVGVWGTEGLGLAREIPEVDILLGTCGKSFGSFGAFVTCSKKMKDYLVNFCPGFIYTTALPPAVIGATQAALELIPEMETERRVYHKRIKNFRQWVQEHGYDTRTSSTQIIPLIIGDDKKTLALSAYLEDRGFLGTAIRPPTVPEESSRIRITLSARHTGEHLEKLVTTLKKWKHE